MSNWIKGCLGKGKGTELDTWSRQWLEAALDTGNKDCLHLSAIPLLLNFSVEFQGKTKQAGPYPDTCMTRSWSFLKTQHTLCLYLTSKPWICTHCIYNSSLLTVLAAQTCKPPENCEMWVTSIWWSSTQPPHPKPPLWSSNKTLHQQSDLIWTSSSTLMLPSVKRMRGLYRC